MYGEEKALYLIVSPFTYFSQSPQQEMEIAVSNGKTVEQRTRVREREKEKLKCYGKVTR